MHAGRALALAALVAAAALAGPPAALAGVDLSTYVRTGRFDLPVGTPPGPLLASEASAVTYDWDTDTLFVVGDEATSVVQVSKTGQLVDQMTLNGTDFNDTEGIAYVGGGRFVLVEERLRQVNRFTYVPNGTLTRAQVQPVKLGTTVGNIGIEGITNDPFSNGFVAVKETAPQGVFQTGIEFAAGTATNGSPTTENPTNLFDPALLGLNDIADVFSLSNLPAALTGTDASHLLFLSQESARVVNADRAGVVANALSIGTEVGTEGVTMDNAGRLYLVNEAGGGSGKPQLWVYESGTPAPSVTLQNAVTSIAENTSTANRVKIADIAIVGGGTPSLTGADAAFFEIANNALYLKAGTALNRATKPSYTVAVATPNATSAPLTLTVTAAASQARLIITEVSPWSSGNSPYAADWFEVTNAGTSAVDLTGYKMDDSSNAFASAAALTGISSIAPGESVVFLEGDTTKPAQFKTFWNVPDVKVGTYSGGGVGLSTDGDAVNLFDPSGTRIAGVSFGPSTNFFTFDNAAGAPAVSQLSAVGVNGAFAINGATGSPGIRRFEVSQPGTFSGSVPARLALTLDAPATFAPFIAGVAHDYFAHTTATVISTAGDAALTMSEPGGGHLANGAFELARALEVNADGGDYAPVSATPTTLLTYPGPISNDKVTIGVKQTIGAHDALRTGAYSKTLTFTLSTTTP